MRYRYEAAGWADKVRRGNLGDLNAQSSLTKKQDHRIRVRAGAKADIGAGFKVYGQLQYGNDTNGGYGAGNNAPTDGTFKLRQAYVQYDSDYNLGFIAGRQQLNTLWTNDIVGFAGKGYYTGVEGLTLAAFAVDSFETDDGDQIFGSDGLGGARGALRFNSRIQPDINSDGELVGTDASDFFFRQNFYGAAAIATYDTGFGTIDPQLWLGYLNKRAFFYALDVKYNLPINDNFKWGLAFDYLGNTVTKETLRKFKDVRGAIQTNGVDNGNFFNLAGTIEAYGFDATLGGLYYGAKNRYTVNTIEDTGNFDLNVGKEILYLKGSQLTNSFGVNKFVYANLGYTYDALRVGGQIVYGGTDTGRGRYNTAAENQSFIFGGGEKTELVAEASYNLSKKINIRSWYSYVDYDSKTKAPVRDASNKKNTVRLQATYKF